MHEMVSPSYLHLYYIADLLSKTERNMYLLLSKEGESAGELSLLPERELWYTMIVVSATAEIMCVDHMALLDYFAAENQSESGGPGVKELLVAVAEEDRKLYSLAVQRQVMMGQFSLVVILSVVVAELDLKDFDKRFHRLTLRKKTDNNRHLVTSPCLQHYSVGFS
jgi:hypothetical protein